MGAVKWVCACGTVVMQWRYDTGEHFLRELHFSRQKPIFD